MAQEVDYRGGILVDSRTIIWIVSELHLMFGAFVLGVPIFAVIVEIIGARTKDPRYDRMAKDFTRLLSAAFATTAALGGLLTFTLYSLYPSFMAYLTGVFHKTFYIYALLFFAETFCLYFYYYSWDWLKHRKGIHISLGILLNLVGTAIMMISNSWASFMMSPVGIEKTTGEFVGTTLQALMNPLWMPLNFHRILGNVVFGGLVAGAYAAIKFISANNDKERAHYDWMGYTGNFVAISSFIFLPFAGYYLGREIYSVSPIMGNNMMGGTFSWTFIIQALQVGLLFIMSNYYLWLGMGRIPGAERYQGYVKYLNLVLLLSFAVWLTPHNLPLSSEEQILVGGQYHPVLKYLGLMSAKNAVINLMILSTFFSFLLYRRGNKGRTIPFSDHGLTAKIVLGVVGLIAVLILGTYARSLFTLDPEGLGLAAEKARYILLPAWLLVLQIAVVFLAIIMTFRDWGKFAQAGLFAVTALSGVLILGIYGFIVMAEANPFLRNIAVTQWLMLLTTLLTTGVIDIFLFRRAEIIGGLRWGQVGLGSQYVLLFLAVLAVMTMGIMGFIRSGLRENWHIYGVLQDTSNSAFTPSDFYAASVIAFIVVVFFAMIALVFWMSELGEKKGDELASAGLPQAGVD
jgi:cytochrome bd-type quinol oxidase subunit 1